MSALVEDMTYNVTISYTTSIEQPGYGSDDYEFEGFHISSFRLQIQLIVGGIGILYRMVIPTTYLEFINVEISSLMVTYTVLVIRILFNFKGPLSQ